MLNSSQYSTCYILWYISVDPLLRSPNDIGVTPAGRGQACAGGAVYGPVRAAESVRARARARARPKHSGGPGAGVCWRRCLRSRMHSPAAGRACALARAPDALRRGGGGRVPAALFTVPCALARRHGRAPSTPAGRGRACAGGAVYGPVCAVGPPAERARLRAGASARARGIQAGPAALFTVPYAPPGEREK